jgi:hypothetical protein
MTLWPSESAVCGFGGWFVKKPLRINGKPLPCIAQLKRIARCNLKPHRAQYRMRVI